MSDDAATNPSIHMDVELGPQDPVKVLQSSKSSGFASRGMTITFKDLSYTVPSNTEKGKEVFLLNNVSGFFDAQNMSALMGPSGSGKTTLLDVLAGRKTAGKTQGHIAFAGQKPTVQFLRRYTGYVEQFDTLLPILTVEEMLMYTAEMKRSMNEPLSSKKEAVNALIQRLGLEVCRNVKIGNNLAKGISGGQSKRVNIGIALITNPRVLFLDEPTSGLDSYTSNEVMTVVKTLVQDGVTICATIHSPSQYCFSLFDTLIMLVRGRVVYFGPRGQEAITFAQSVCMEVKPYTDGYNDAEYLVDLVTEADRKGYGGKLADHYAGSALKQSNDRLLLEAMNKTEDLPESIQKELAVKSATSVPIWWGLRKLIKYRTLRNYQDPEFLGPRIGDKIMISLLIMTLYLGIGDNYKTDNLVNISAVLFMWCTLPAFGAAAYVPALVLERPLFLRERADGMYHVITYLLAKMFDELIIALLATLPVSAWVFFGIQFKGEWVLFWLVYYITLTNGIVLAYLIAALSPTLDIANALLPTYVVTLLFFAGFLFRFDDMPPWWQWYAYINFLRYAWGALMINQFRDEDPVFIDRGPTNQITVLEQYGFTNKNGYTISKWSWVGFEAIFVLVWFVLAYLVLSYKKYSSR